MSSPSPAAEKTCILCKQDCSNKPRTKDAQGRYTCKTCFDARQKQLAAMQAKPAAPKPAPAPVLAPADDDNGFMASLLEQSPAAAGAAGPPCASCGMVMQPGAVVCLACGHNAQTGQKAAVRVTKERAAPAAVTAAASGSITLVGAVIGGVVAGALGAGVWAAIAYSIHREHGIIAWGVGIATGFGVAAGARNNTGTLTGVIAAVIAIATICAGKFAAVSMIVDDIGGQAMKEIHVTDEMAIGMISQDVATEWTDAGKKLKWPEGTTPETAKFATEQSEFPPEVWAEATKRWTKASDQWKRDFRDRREAEIKANVNTLLQDAKGEGFFATFGLLDFAFFGLAVFSAYGIGSGTGVGGDD